MSTSKSNTRLSNLSPKSTVMIVLFLCGTAYLVGYGHSRAGLPSEESRNSRKVSLQPQDASISALTREVSKLRRMISVDEQRSGKRSNKELPITQDDLKNERAARERLRDEFLAIPLMTSGTPAKQSIQMVLRQRHVLRELVFLGMSTRFLYGSTEGTSFDYLPKILFEGITACRDAPDTISFCMLFQDDTVFHPSFYLAAGRIIAAMESEWVSVHMCPGAFSPILPSAPKKYHGPPVVGRDPALFIPNPSAWSGLIDGTDEGRGNNTIFKSWPRSRWKDITFFVTAGQPVAFILRRAKAAALLEMLHTSPPNGRLGGHDDVRLSRSTTVVNSTIAKTPLLCYHLRSTSSTVDKRQASKEDTSAGWPYN